MDRRAREIQRRVADRWLQAALDRRRALGESLGLGRVAKRGIDLADYGLDGLTRGEPVRLFHGTTRSFTRFDLSKSRKDLVDDFYGAGIFLTPSESVAWDYAHANRNIGFDHDELLADARRANRNMAEF